MSEYQDNDSSRGRYKKGRKNWDETDTQSESEAALKPSRNTLDVRIFTLGFKNRVESNEYLKFKIRPNKGLKVEQIALADLMTLSDTSQIAGGSGNIGNRKKRKVPKPEDETIESGRPRKISSRPYTPELASPRAFQPRQSQ